MFELWRKRRELDKITKFCDNKIRKAKREGKSSDEINELLSERFAESDYIEEEINSIVTTHLVRKAQRLFLPVLAYGDDDVWERGDFTGLRYLKPGGVMKLRNLIREETAARRKAVLEWVTPFIGIIGAMTGLLAVILSMT
jgi:hypothetical protein